MIYISSDHGGFEQKGRLVAWLKGENHAVADLGPSTLDPEDDYPKYAEGVGRALQKGSTDDQGILLCRSGAGMTIAANKMRSIRAVNALSVALARHAREHNDANVLVLSADFMNFDAMQQTVETFLKTPFSQAERHHRRVQQIAALEAEEQ